MDPFQCCDVAPRLSNRFAGALGQGRADPFEKTQDARPGKLVTRILATDNYDVASAESGEVAVSMIEDPWFGKLDLLVTDLMMPGMNGRELALIARRKYPNTRVLYVTGFADTLFKGLQELGAGESFIEKPFGAEGLLEATRLVMFGHISDGREPRDKRDNAQEWADDRLRAKVVRLLKKLRMA